jgi:hypothetical protein
MPVPAAWQVSCLRGESEVFRDFPPHASRLPTIGPQTLTSSLVPSNSTTTMTKIVDLPLEILLEICAHSNRLPTPLHPLNALALTNKHFYTVVEEYCRNQLKKHANFTPPRSKTFRCRKKWLSETCQFCFRKSQRRAMLYPSLTCCRDCDKQYFPKMVTPPLPTSCTQVHRRNG